MSISPELHIGHIPRIAMVGAVLLSMAYRSDIKPTPPKAATPEMTIVADPRLVDYTVAMSQGLVQNYLVADLGKISDRLTSATPAEIAAKEITPKIFEEWSRVDVCEEDGDWHADEEGPDYSGGLGISVDNWDKYGGRQFSAYGAGATPDEQIVIARRIEVNPPDQNGCDPGGW